MSKYKNFIVDLIYNLFSFLQFYIFIKAQIYKFHLFFILAQFQGLRNSIF